MMYNKQAQLVLYNNPSNIFNILGVAVVIARELKRVASGRRTRIRYAADVF
jgi:hypothetical protein